jgi:copper chaperone CopZ
VAGTDLRVLELRCPCCAEVVLGAVRDLPGVGGARLDFSSGRLHVELDPGVGSEASIRAAVSAAGYRVAGEVHAPSTGELAHDADLAPITCGTRHDRMQYEMPHTRAQEAHREPAEYPGGGMGGMDHDMSDP